LNFHKSIIHGRFGNWGPKACIYFRLSQKG